MNRDTFWRLIESSRTEDDDHDALTRRLRGRLEALSTEELEDYARIFGALMKRSYDHRLWGAAWVIGRGDCSSDSFDYFRCWLIAHGERVFTRALRDPDSLAEVVVRGEPAHFEALMYVHVKVYEARTGQPLDDPNPARSGYLEEPSGEAWDPDELQALYPRLSSLGL